MKNKKTVIIIGGPTASGKSQIAVDLACKLQGVIINADSSQVYKELPILTNSPNDTEKKQVPHYLYNFIDLEYDFKVTEWTKLVKKIIKQEILNNKIPIIVGGNGFYINTLIHGITNIPEASIQNRMKAEQTLKNLGIIKFREFLCTIDPGYTKKFSDPYRLSRSYSIYLETGQPFSMWQQKPKTNQLKEKYIFIKILPERIELYHKINERFKNMIKLGAIEETQKILKSNINPKIYKKVIGLNELINYINNIITLEKAIEISSQKTRNYAKRQITWFKKQLSNDDIIINNKSNINLYKIITDKMIKNY